MALYRAPWSRQDRCAPTALSVFARPSKKLFLLPKTAIIVNFLDEHFCG